MHCVRARQPAATLRRARARVPGVPASDTGRGRGELVKTRRGAPVARSPTPGRRNSRAYHHAGAVRRERRKTTKPVLRAGRLLFRGALGCASRSLSRLPGGLQVGREWRGAAYAEERRRDEAAPEDSAGCGGRGGSQRVGGEGARPGNQPAREATRTEEV
ncbi:unnamed protein product [Amoebophrya sp. A120]|nr:unnamed protein product [Amoebophrya sp. A120]|eukprot:GSA120T00009395001.1